MVLSDVEKVLAHKNRLTKASASEKVGACLEYQIVCLIVQEKLACKWSAKITIKENNPNSVGVVRAIARRQTIGVEFPFPNVPSLPQK